jgi:hypothetical protein
MTDAAIIVCAILGAGLGASVIAALLLRAGAAYDKDMGLEAEDRE